MTFELDVGFLSDKGQKSENEDFAALLEGAGTDASKGVIAAIADGVSTGGGGAQAAQITVNSLLNDYFATPQTWDTSVALDRVITAQNRWLVSHNRLTSPVLGLTTLTAIVLRGQTYTLAHIGDTRAYLLREGRLEQLTQDHVVPSADLSHQLTRCIGLDERILVDYSQGELRSGDQFILLSDGVHGVVSAKELTDLTRQGLTAQKLCEALIQRAHKKNSPDNLTALVVRVNGALESTLYDEQRKATELLVPDLLKNGSTIDGLVVTALVSDSGVYRLYQVREPSTQKLYALKTLHKSRAHDREECLTLAHEAWVAKRMQTGPARKNLAQLIDWPAAAAKLNASPLQDQTQSFFYLLYEWHSGETLEQIIKSKREIEIAQIVYWITEATKALGFIHRQGVVHRDIKPANLHLGEDSVLRVLDFGVAMSGKDRADSRYLLAGSPSYMNPEQWPGYSKNSPPEGSLPDIQSDLYALGVTLYQLLTNGKLPYGEILPYQIGRYSKDPLAPSRHNPKVPIWLDHIVLKAVAKNKDHRFETAEEMVLALERGAIRPLSAPGSTAYLQRDPASVWKLLLAISALINFALIYWVVFALK